MGYLILLKLKETLSPQLSNGYYVALGSLLLNSAALMFWAMRHFKSGLVRTQKHTTLRDKLDSYFSLSLNKYKTFLLSGVMLATGLYLTANDLFILGYVIGLILLSLGRPSLPAFFNDLQLSEEDKTILLEKQPIT